MAVDISLWRIRQDHQQVMVQGKILMVKCLLLKKKQLELKRYNLKVQLQLQSCLRLQELLKCSGECLTAADAANGCHCRTDERSMPANTVATDNVGTANEHPGDDEMPRSWDEQPWRWCAAGYGGCCQHCPRNGMEYGSFVRERTAVTEQLAGTGDGESAGANDES